MANEEEVKQEINEEKEESGKASKKKMGGPVLVIIGVSAGLLAAMAGFLFLKPAGNANASEKDAESAQSLYLCLNKYKRWAEPLKIGEYQIFLGKDEPQISATVTLTISKELEAGITDIVKNLKQNVGRLFQSIVFSSKAELINKSHDIGSILKELEKNMYDGLVNGTNPVTDEKVLDKDDLPFNKKNLKDVYISNFNISTTY